jgi:hypothetical protein
VQSAPDRSIMPNIAIRDAVLEDAAAACLVLRRSIED